MNAQTPVFKAPDFAYPQTVEEDARQLLASASGMQGLRADAVRLRAVLEICAAQTMVDFNAEYSQPAFIAEQAEAAQGAGRAMLLALEGNKLADIYSRRRWAYDRVDAPVEPLPADVAQWSGAQFKARVAQLFAQAAACAADCEPVSLAVFDGAVEYTPIALKYVPTVEDFVRLTAADAFAQIGERALAAKTADEALEIQTEGIAPWFFWYGRTHTSAKELEAAYLRWQDSADARYLLQLLCGAAEEEEGVDDDDISTTGIKPRKELVRLLEQSLERFPSWEGNDELRNELASLTAAKASFTAPTLVAPGAEIDLKIDFAYAKELEAGLYALSADNDNFDMKWLATQKPVVSAHFATEGTDGTARLALTAPAPGWYALLVRVDGTIPPNRWNVPRVLVSPLLGFSVDGTSRKAAVAVDLTTGMPLSGVTVKANAFNNRRKLFGGNTRTVGTTGKDGFVLFRSPSGQDGNEYLTFTYGNRTYDFDRGVYSSAWSEPKRKESFNCQLMTDRPLYHPGDEVQWAVVATRRGARASEPEVLAGKTITLTMLDANGQKTDSATVVTDAFGRATGTFKTPKGGLTGYYTISSRDAGGIFGRVMVSDFKLPVFEAEITSIERNVPTAGSVRIKGKATTFTGMPVSGATVNLTLQGATRWRWFAPQRQVAQYETVTDASGAFVYDIPASVLAQAKEQDGYTDFVLTADVTTAAAETAAASRNFTTGKPYVLAVQSCPDKADATKPLRAVFAAYNADGDSKPVELVWTMGIRKGKEMAQTVASGRALAGSGVEIDLAKVPAGQYEIRLEAVDSELAEPTWVHQICAYNIKRNEVPNTGQILFLPQTSLKATSGERKLKLTLGIAGGENACVFVAARQGDSLVSMERHILKPGFSDLDIKLPSDNGDMQLLLATVREGKVYRAGADIKRTVKEPVVVVAESFRNRIETPGTEHWRFRLCEGNKALANSAMTATMYNRAIDQLASGSWPSAFGYGVHRGWMSLSVPHNGDFSGYLSNPVALKPVERISWPQFMFKGAANIYDLAMAAPMMRNAKMAQASAMEEREAADCDEEECAQTEDSAELNGAADTGSGANPEEPEQSFRVAEQLQILWQPGLTADADGNIDLVFDMPDAIGSWTFKAFAWNKQAKAAAYAAECLSNKPVMVQANLPRFLRQGDAATVLATVYNNTDAEATVVTTVELFDVADGKVFKTNTSTSTIAPGSSAIVGIDVEAGYNLSAVGYRVRSVLGAYADGEQGAIPVLASSATVVESTTFYVDPSQSTPVTITDTLPAGSTATLQYCQNPVWTVVKAMRGLQGTGKTSTEAVSNLFSALAGQYIINVNPAIASAIKEWQENPAEEALVSMLSRNDDLKKLLLDQTPWVQAAQNNTTRMASLAQLLSAEKTAAAAAASVKALAKLQNKDGGFAWGPWSDRSSVWATETVLTTMAIAHSLGMDVPEADGMFAHAFDFLQAAATGPRASVTDRELAFIASLWPELKVNVAASKVIRATVADIAVNWRHDSTVGKAADVIILEANGRAALAAQVLESIRQHAKTEPRKGMSFPNIDDIRSYATIIQAFKTLYAPAAEIDAMRQWILVRAQASDDLGAYNPDYVIAAVLLTGSNWTDVPVRESVTVNGAPLAISRIESATGYFAQKLEVSAGKVEISVLPNGKTPSYGSLTTVSVRPMNQIEAHPGRDIAVNKRFLVLRGGQWVETKEFNLGERVRVQLLVEARADLDYVTITDERAAALEPVDQLAGYVYDGSLAFYRENGDAVTNLFIGYLPKGTYYVNYDMTAAAAGIFASGMATVQSQYAPEITAHSGACAVTVLSGR